MGEFQGIARPSAAVALTVDHCGPDNWLGLRAWTRTSSEPDSIQEMHITVGHTVREMIERELFESRDNA